MQPNSDPMQGYRCSEKTVNSLNDEGLLKEPVPLHEQTGRRRVRGRGAMRKLQEEGEGKAPVERAAHEYADSSTNAGLCRRNEVTGQVPHDLGAGD
jgi:hypothetical protein